MKIIRNILLFIILIHAPAESQLQSVVLFGSGDIGMNKRLGVTGALSYGGGLSITYFANDEFFLVFDAGYADYAIDQDNEVQKWGWSIWERRYRNWVNIYSADTANFRSSVISVQNVETVPVSLKFGYQLSLSEDIWIAPVVGVGVEFYTRKLYHEETWTRKYPQDNYQFTYSYHNFAPYKYGNPVFAVGGLKGSIQLSNLISIESGVTYKIFVDTGELLGYDNFPMNSTLSFYAGIGFNY